MAAAIPENWVVLKPGVPVTLHFAAHKMVDRVITDPVFGVQKKVSSLMFLVDQENGAVVTKSFSVVSQKLAEDLRGYLEGERYKAYRFTFIKDAPGLVPPRILEVRPF